MICDKCKNRRECRLHQEIESLIVLVSKMHSVGYEGYIDRITKAIVSLDCNKYKHIQMMAISAEEYHELLAYKAICEEMYK